MATSSCPGLDLAQVAKAVTALKRFTGAQAEAPSAGLLDEDEFFYLMLSLKKTSPERKGRDKPHRLPLPHPIHSFEGADVCLLVKDDKAGEGHKKAKKRLAALEGKAGVAKVIGTSKLRTKYESFEAKRNLCNQFDLFLADDRILPSLPKLIGKQFFRRKKQPIPVKLSVKDWDAQFHKAAASTYLHLSGGSCISIKVARASQPEEHVRANIAAVLDAAVARIPKKWGNVQALFLKTADSVALPLYQCAPDEARVI